MFNVTIVRLVLLLTYGLLAYVVLLLITTQTDESSDVLGLLKSFHSSPTSNLLRKTIFYKTRFGISDYQYQSPI